MAASAKRQGAYLAAHLSEAGLFPDSDGRLDWTGQWVELEALANLTGPLSVEKMPHSAQNRHRDRAAPKKFQTTTERLYKVLTGRAPSGATEKAQGVQAPVGVAANLSELRQSVLPIPVAKGKFEQDENPLFYGYPGLLKPPMAGGRFGIAPVSASRIAWDA